LHDIVINSWEDDIHTLGIQSFPFCSCREIRVSVC